MWRWIMAKGRRGNQEGTFYQRSNGSWCGQIMLNSKRYTVYAQGIQECRRKLREKINSVNSCDMTSDDVLFSEYASQYIQNQIDMKIIKMSTANLKRICVNHFVNTMGDYKVKNITLEMLNKYTSKMITDGKASTTIRNRISYISSILKAAANDGIATHYIPQGSVNYGPVQKKSILLPTIEEAKEIIESFTYEFDRVFLYILLYAGLRGGECACLKWSDIDLKLNKIYINRTLYKVQNIGIIEQAPKGNRVGEFAQFSTELHNILVAYKERTKDQRSDYLFEKRRKIGINSICTLFSRKVRSIGKQGGLHLLRHLHASILLNNHVDLKTIQSQLRHSSVTTTDRYLHELKDDVRNSIKELHF